MKPRNRAIFLKVLMIAIACSRLSCENALGAENTSVSDLPRLREAKSYSLEAGISDTPTAVAWSNDGTRLAAFSSEGQSLSVWNIDGRVLKVLHPNMNYLDNSLLFFGDDELLTPPEGNSQASSVDRWVFDIWGISSGKVEKKVVGPEPEKRWEANSAAGYAISPDRTLIAVFTQLSGLPKFGPAQEFQENPLTIYSTKSWQAEKKIEIVAPTSVAFSPDGGQLAIGTGTGRIILYDVRSSQIVSTIATCDRATLARTIDYSPDGKFIVAGLDSHTKNCSVKIFRVSDGAVTGAYPEEKRGSPWKVLWHPSGKFIVFAPHDRTLRVWNPESPSDPGVTINDINSMCLAFFPSGKQLASCNSGRVTVFNVN